MGKPALHATHAAFLLVEQIERAVPVSGWISRIPAQLRPPRILHFGKSFERIPCTQWTARWERFSEG